MAETESEAAEAVDALIIGSFFKPVRPVKDAAEEILLLWAIQQPIVHKHNSFVIHSSLRLQLDACGRQLTIFQSPSSMSTPGVTGAVMWDSGVVLAKFLEHAVETGMLLLRGKKVVELGAGCGLVGCIAALLGAQVILTDLPDRLKLLKKNVEANVEQGYAPGSATVAELEWGDDPDCKLTEPMPDFDVIYSEGAVTDLLATLQQLSSIHTTIFLAGELRNDVVLEYFLELALQDFEVGHVDQTFWHPDYCSHRVAIFVLVKKHPSLKSSKG
ncbi:uncharacterized protein [Aristolochia californica]|uniref:uncharacterized protein isoform X2 n=1 Tax=Aristolochia californica TaxID=171875 RepID=UPI0035DEC26A